jgi:hypothetical protein
MATLRIRSPQEAIVSALPQGTISIVIAGDCADFLDGIHFHNIDFTGVEIFELFGWNISFHDCTNLSAKFRGSCDEIIFHKQFGVVDGVNFGQNYVRLENIDQAGAFVLNGDFMKTLRNVEFRGCPSLTSIHVKSRHAGSDFGWDGPPGFSVRDCPMLENVEINGKISNSEISTCHNLRKICGDTPISLYLRDINNEVEIDFPKLEYLTVNSCTKLKIREISISNGFAADRTEILPNSQDGGQRFSLGPSGHVTITRGILPPNISLDSREMEITDTSGLKILVVKDARFLHFHNLPDLDSFHAFTTSEPDIFFGNCPRLETVDFEGKNTIRRLQFVDCPSLTDVPWIRRNAARLPITQFNRIRLKDVGFGFTVGSSKIYQFGKSFFTSVSDGDFFLQPISNQANLLYKNRLRRKVQLLIEGKI